MEAMARGATGSELGDAPAHMLEEVERLTQVAIAANEKRQAASELAQQARMAFNELMRQKQEEQRELEHLQAKEEILMRMGRAWEVGQT